MTARLRSSLHPLTVASIDMQTDGCCDPNRLDRLWLCDYHMGYQDGIDALLAWWGHTTQHQQGGQ